MAQSKEMKYLIGKIEAMRDGINPIIKKAFKRRSVEVVKYNTEKQLFKAGEKSDGLKLPKYAASTIAYKRKKGQRIANMTLKDSGDFYKSIRVNPGDESVEITTDGSLDYTDHLENRFGGNIYGMTAKHQKQFYNRFIKKPVARHLKKSVK